MCTADVLCQVAGYRIHPLRGHELRCVAGSTSSPLALALRLHSRLPVCLHRHLAGLDFICLYLRFGRLLLLFDERSRLLGVVATRLLLLLEEQLTPRVAVRVDASLVRAVGEGG